VKKGFLRCRCGRASGACANDGLSRLVVSRAALKPAKRSQKMHFGGFASLLLSAPSLCVSLRSRRTSVTQVGLPLAASRRHRPPRLSIAHMARFAIMLIGSAWLATSPLIADVPLLSTRKWWPHCQTPACSSARTPPVGDVVNLHFKICDVGPWARVLTGAARLHHRVVTGYSRSRNDCCYRRFFSASSISCLELPLLCHTDQGRTS